MKSITSSISKWFNIYSFNFNPRISRACKTVLNGKHLITSTDLGFELESLALLRKPHEVRDKHSLGHPEINLVWSCKCKYLRGIVFKDMEDLWNSCPCPLFLHSPKFRVVKDFVLKTVYGMAYLPVAFLALWWVQRMMSNSLTLLSTGKWHSTTVVKRRVALAPRHGSGPVSSLI